MSVLLGRRRFLSGMAASGAAGLLGRSFGPAAAADMTGPETPRSLMPEIVRSRRAIEQRLASMPDGLTLYVPIGERHDLPSDSMFLRGLLLTLMDAGHRVSVGFELPEQDTYRYARRFAGRDGDGGASRFENVASCNRHGELSLEIAARRHDRSASIAQKLLFATCVEKRVDTVMCDLSSTGNLLDETPLFSALKQKRHPGFSGDVPTTSAEGMDLRNEAMAITATDFARRNRSRIHLQSCGLAHLTGYKPYGCGPATSLTRHLMSRARVDGHDVLPVLLKDRECLPDNLYTQAFPSLLSVEGMPSRPFNYKNRNPMDCYLMMKEELAYCRVLADDPGLYLRDPEPMSDRSPHWPRLTGQVHCRVDA